MTSEIRANTLKNRVGLGTVSYTNTGIVVSGIVTANSFSGPISGTTGTFSGDVDIIGDLDVDGHTNLDNVSVAGVTTFTGRSDHSSLLQMLAGNPIRLNNDANSAHCEIDCYGGAGFRLTSYNQTMFTCENGSNTKFYTNSGTSRLEITNGGDVLVNTGTLHIPDALTHSGDTDTKIRFPAANQISFETTGSEAVRIDEAGRVGIGHDNPSQLLTVRGNAPIIRIEENQSGGSKRLDLGVTNSGAVGYIGANQSASSLAFQTVGAERLRITSTGSIGINQSSPAVKLHLYDSSNATARTELFRISGGNRTADSFETGFRFFAQAPSTNGNRHVTFTSNANTGLTIQPYETSTGNAATDRNILLCPDGGEVLIGATARGREKGLHLAGADQDPNGAWTQMGIYSTDAQASNKGGSIGFGGQDGSVAKQQFAAIKGAKENGTSGNYAGYMAFYTRPAGAVTAERLRITSGGELWIGTTSGISNSGYGGFSLNGSSGSLLSLMHNGTEKLRLFGHTNPSIQYAGDLTFYSGVSGGTERARITSGGEFQIQNNELQITSSNSYACHFNYLNNGSNYISFAQSKATTFRNNVGSGNVMIVYGSGNIGAPSGNNIYNASDERLKENMVELTNGLDKIKKLKPYSFTWKKGFDKDIEGVTQYGFGAHQAKTVDEKLVEKFSENDIELNGETIKDPLRVNEKHVIPLLVKAIQEQQEQIEILKSEVDALKG